MGFGRGHEIKDGYREGGACQKYKGKRGGGQKKYFSKTLKWHNVFIFKKNSL